MKKDDIIKQKLFETNNLSQFYLDFIIKCKWDDESPLLLANAYKQKLYEIVDRYDRMLDSNKQREQLCLSFEKQKPPRYYTNNSNQSQINKSLNTPTPSSSALIATSNARTSTPNKCYTPNNYSTLNTNCNSKSTCSSYASTPTTPCQTRTFVRSSSSSSSSSFALNNYSNTYSTLNRGGGIGGYKSPYNQARSYLNISSSASKQNNKPHSNSKLELEQRIASIYYDDYDDDVNDDNLYDDLNDNTNKNTRMQNDASSLLTSNEINHNNQITKLPFYIRNESNDSEYGYETDYQIEELDTSTTVNRSQNIEKSYSNLSKDSGVLVDSYHSDYSNCIFSGVGCLNNSTANINEESKLITVNKNLINDLISTNIKTNEEDEEEEEEDNTNNNSEQYDENDDVVNENENEPCQINEEEEEEEELNSNSNSNSSPSSNEEDEEENTCTNSTATIRLENKTESDLTLKEQNSQNINTPVTNTNNNNLNQEVSSIKIAQNLSLKKIFNSKLESRRLQQQQILQQQFNGSNPIVTNSPNYGLLNLQTNKFANNQTYRITNAKASLLNKKILKKNLNLDLNLDIGNGIDTSNFVSLLVESNNNTNNDNKNQSSLIEQYKRNHLMNNNNNNNNSNSNGNEINCSNLSLCSSISTPSPSSSTTSNSSSTTESNSVAENEDQNQPTSTTTTNTNDTITNQANLLTASSATLNTNNSPNILKSTNPLFFNYNSLMNVSMLDSIQVTNTNLDLDNMSSSILMFN